MEVQNCVFGYDDRKFSKLEDKCKVIRFDFIILFSYLIINIWVILNINKIFYVVHVSMTYSYIHLKVPTQVYSQKKMLFNDSSYICVYSI